MKKTLIIIAMAASAVLAASCHKDDQFSKDKAQDGTLSFASFTISEDQEVVTKASEADGSYAIIIYDSDENIAAQTTYSAVKAADYKMTLPAGKYTLVARSTADAVPTAAFEQPVYGTSTSFTITAGQTTTLGSLTCTLLQCKVTVSYSDEFLQMVTGTGSATVTVTSGYPLEYDMSYSGLKASYDQKAGYFAVNNGSNTTMEVTFKGSIEGKSQKMTKSFTGI